MSGERMVEYLAKFFCVGVCRNVEAEFKFVLRPLRACHQFFKDGSVGSSVLQEA